jgi:hypothetical protein
MYSKGVSWIDDCRIPFENENIDFTTTQKGKVYGRNSLNESITERNTTHYSTQGRFPANILVCDDMLNDGIITKQSQRTYKPTDNSASFFGNLAQAHGTGIGDSGSSSRYYNIDKWFDNLIK